ncbi:hypothetical protein [Streptomyces sp. NPDC058299]|uniref:hypothetical protein n=1 Tax=unclassified Streptomyces TaxID=2593676 RepID=UPI0036E477F1
MGGTSLLVTVLVLVGTFALTVQQRHRELALLRAVAATSGRIRALLGREALIVGAAPLGREALIVGAVAGTAGALLGMPLGGWSYARFVALGAVPDTLERTVGVFPPLAALTVTLLGAWAAARIASRKTPGSVRPRHSRKPGPSPPGPPGGGSPPGCCSSPAESSSSSSSPSCAPSPPLRVTYG